MTAQNFKLFGKKFLNNVSQSYYDIFQVNGLVQN